VDSYTGPAEFVQGDHTVAVACSHNVTRDWPSGLSGWAGSWWNPEPPYLLGGCDAVLRLPSGEEGRVLISEINLLSDAADGGRFVGSGPVPGGEN